MTNQKINPWTLLIGFIIGCAIWVAVGLVFPPDAKSEALTIEQEAAEKPVQAAPEAVRGFFSDKAAQETVIICKYRIEATEEAQRPVKFGNFETQYVTDRYHQDTAFETILPGKDISAIDLLKVVPAQEQGAKVVAIRSVERIVGTCKPYKFVPDPPQDLPE